MKAYYYQKILLFLFLLALIGVRQDVAAQDVLLATQADVDAFDPTTTVINGSLNIGEVGVNSDITHLNTLSNLTKVNGYLQIQNNINLTNLNGLSNLFSTDSTFIISSGNDNLSNIDGLSNLTNVGGLVVDGTYLTNIDVFSNITSVEGNIAISHNAFLPDIDGLSNITSIDGKVWIIYNDKLLNVDGLSNLTSIPLSLWIANNTSLRNVDGARNITSIGLRLNISYNGKLTDCCGIQNIVKNGATAIGDQIIIKDNPSECSTEEEVLEASCSMKLITVPTPPCIGADNGSIQVFVIDYEDPPFYYDWMRQEDGLTGSGVSVEDEFTIDMLSVGTYTITVTNTALDTALKPEIVLSQKLGSIFEIIEVKTTNSSNGQSNGNITLTTTGGSEPYTYSWTGAAFGNESGVTTDFYTIPSLSYGEYMILVEDDTGANKVVNISLLDETVQVIPCEKPLDIVILNDVSSSVDAIEYNESKQFFVDFLKVVNIGTGTDESRAAIIEWSSNNEQALKIPLTGNITTLSSYLADSRIFSGGTAPHQAMNFGGSYLDMHARTDVEKVIILSTDGTDGQISSSLIALADEFKAKGYHIITIAFDNAYSHFPTRDKLRRVASVDALAPGAPSYSMLDANLAKSIVFNYLCPVDPGSSATAYFNRDGAIDIIEIDPIGACPFPDFVEVTFDVSAFRELSIPAGTPVTFYHNNPYQAGASPILTWEIPCAIAIDSTESYSILLPIEGPSNIYAVFNDDGVQGPPINFPITLTEEVAYSNNIDNERICLDEQATIQAFKYSTLPIPACDTLVNYSINVCNISDVDAFGITIEDVPPSGFILTGIIFNDNSCATDLGGTYDLPADCCFSLSLTYDAGAAAHGFYGDQHVNLGGPSSQTYIDFNGSTTTDEDVTINGTIDCPSTKIEFTKSVNMDESCDDGFIEFAFTINNEMNVPLKGLTFRDILPAPSTWAYVPYGESGLSIANPEIMGNEAVFIIDEVQANTVATFYMDANLNSWSFDGNLSNTATLENVPDVIQGGYTTLTSNTTSTKITASPKVTLPDTIWIDHFTDTIFIAASLSTLADVTWTTGGDGEFMDDTFESTSYILGTQDRLAGEVLVFVSAESNCNETGASVLIKFIDCPIEVEIIQIGICDNMGTPLDDTDDVYTVDIYVESDTTFQIIHEMNIHGPYEQNTQATLTLSADNVPDILMIEAIGENCFVTEEVNQNRCSLIKTDSLEIFVPNIFSPNGDQINDEWFALVESETSKILECSIFDRWGNKVFYSNDTNPVWNGQYQQNPVNAGVYIYVISYVDVNLTKRQKVGDITVIY